jgi:hypothetical protein
VAEEVEDGAEGVGEGDAAGELCIELAKQSAEAIRLRMCSGERAVVERSDVAGEGKEERAGLAATALLRKE